MSVTTRDQAKTLREQLTRMAPDFATALPSHIKPERFQRVVMTVVQQQPDLLMADRQSLLGACLKCAADGLVPDGREAALVIFNAKDGERWIKKAQYMPMMGGILKRIRNSGEIASVQAHIIYKNDRFVVRRGLNETIEHEPKFPGDRGEMIGAYAVAKFKDGSDPVFEIMDVDELNKVAAASRSKGSGPWKDWREEMCRKTVFRRLAKWLPMDAETEELYRRDDQNGAPTALPQTIEGEADPAPTQIEGPHSKLDALEGETITEDGEIIGDDRHDTPDPAAHLLHHVASLDLIALTGLSASATHRASMRLLPTDEDRARVEAAIQARLTAGRANAAD